MKVCFIPQVKTSILLATWIVIGVEIWMKGKAQRDLSFSWRYIFHMVIQEAIDSNVIKLSMLLPTQLSMLLPTQLYAI